MLQLVKLVSVLQNVQSIWGMVAGQILENKDLVGTPVYALANTVDWFQSQFATVDVRQPTQPGTPVGRIANTYYKSNPTTGNGQIYTGIVVGADWVSGGKNYKGDVVYVRSADLGVSQKEVKKEGNANMGFWYGLAAFAAVMVLSSSEETKK